MGRAAAVSGREYGFAASACRRRGGRRQAATALSKCVLSYTFAASARGAKSAAGRAGQAPAKLSGFHRTRFWHFPSSCGPRAAGPVVVGRLLGRNLAASERTRDRIAFSGGVGRAADEF